MKKFLFVLMGLVVAGNAYGGSSTATECKSGEKKSCVIEHAISAERTCGTKGKWGLCKALQCENGWMPAKPDFTSCAEDDSAPNKKRCVVDENCTKEIPNAEYAIKKCNTATGYLGNCTLQNCKRGFRKVNNACEKDTPEQKTCKETRTTAEGKACCGVPASVATWNGQHCVCTTPGSTFKFDNNNPRCEVAGGVTPLVVNPNPVTPVTPSYKCDATMVAQLVQWSVEYSDNAEISAAIQKARDYCEGQPNENDFINMYQAIQILIQKINIQITQQQDITTLYAQIEKKALELFGDKSHWKDAEGEFNTARLASDSIAGVVLGTVGGVVTSNLIKKNQVKQGFEDIKCAIGGQTVASYGDEFRVGLQ